MTGAASRLTILGRAECGLCEDLARDLSSLGLQFDTVDIDDDAALCDLYNEAVPVLTLDGAEIARAPLNRATLQQALERAGVQLPARR